MEGPVELSPESVLRFLSERCGRARHAELVQHFRGALGGEPEQRAGARARFKEMVDAVATVRTDPANGTKYVHLKRSLCEGPLSPEPAPPRDLPHISVITEPETRGGDPDALDGVAKSRESGPCPEAAPTVSPPGPDCEPGDGVPPAAALGPPSLASDSRSGLPVSGGIRRKNSLRVAARALAPEPPPQGCEEVDRGCSARVATTQRSSREALMDLAMGIYPQRKRSICPGGSSPGCSSGGGLGKGVGDSYSTSVASSSSEEECSGGGSVTLDPLEHAWMLTASEGKWDRLEALLACEPGLVNKRDFITGFTCLHWAAKHGKQETLALLVNFASKHQLPVNINARTSAGYTALHLAAMHGHVEVVKLLVGAYDADVDIRDYSGKRASQYLSQRIAEETKIRVGALDEDGGESATGSGGGRWRLSKMLPLHLITYKLSHILEDGGDHLRHHHLAEGWAAGKAKDPGCKASGSSGRRLKPRLNNIRF